jgi:serine/threonine protein kinase
MDEVEIFVEAREIQDDAQRQAFLDRACRSDAGLKQRVIAYLHSIESAGDFLEPPSFVPPQISGPHEVWPAKPEYLAEKLETHVLGDFRIGREIGRGGMGVVYEAEQISLGRRVALKVLPYASMLGKTQLARFRNEARAAASLHHPNVVHVHSVGTERGVHYYVMS